MFKKIRTILLPSLLGVLVSGCHMAETIIYEHPPSQEFYKEFNFEIPALQRFKDDNVLFVIDIKGYHLVWLGAYSEQPTDGVYIKSARFIGNGNTRTIEINQQLHIDTLQERDSKVYHVYGDSIKLIQSNDGEFDTFFNEDNQMSIEVTYIIDNVEKTMNFIIDKKIKKGPVFVT